MQVRIKQLGGGDPRYVELPEGSTVQDALTKAAISSVGVTVTVNGSNSTMDTRLSNKNTIMVTTKVAGGLI
jgi:sulfur carrier protein ThiS